jgi:hypothetical protein
MSTSTGFSRNGGIVITFWEMVISRELQCLLGVLPQGLSGRYGISEAGRFITELCIEADRFYGGVPKEEGKRQGVLVLWKTNQYISPKDK